VDGYDPSTYGDGMADVYDDWYADVSDVDATVARLATLAGPGPVLELGVGTGRLALPLAASGITVHGVDASAAMVARLRAKPGGASVDVTLGDMAGPEPAGPYELVFVAYNTFFNLTSEDDQRRCLQNVASRLRPGGRFVVEAFVPPDQAPASAVADVRTLELDRVVLSLSRHEPGSQVAVGQFVDLCESGIRLRPWRIRYASPEQLDRLAAGAGLALLERHAGWRAEPFTGASSVHVSVYGFPPSDG
jgi:SAM-dependent methyltransferase